MSTTRLQYILNEKKRLRNRVERQEEELDELLRKNIRNSLILCEQCDKNSRLSTWVLQERWYYNPNTGDPNGGFSEHGEPETDTLLCPKCGCANYIYTHNQKAKILELRKAGEFLDIFDNRLFLSQC